MIIYLHGEDSFRSRQQLKKMVEKFKADRDPQGYNVVFLDCVKGDASKILSEIQSAPFLAEKRMIVLENLLSNNDKDLVSKILEKITPPTPSSKRGGEKGSYPETNILLFYQGEKPSKIKEVGELDKLLKKEKFAQGFKILKGAQLQGWIKKEVEERGGKINSYALNFIVQNIGADMWFLNSLIDQLIAYKNSYNVILSGAKDLDSSPEVQNDGGEVQNDKSNTDAEIIESKDVSLFLEENVDDNIFNMVDVIVAGDKKQAFKLVNKQRELGEDDFKLMAMIVRQFRILIQIRSLYEEKESLRSDEMAKVLGFHPFVVKKSLGLVKKYSLNKLKEIYHELLQIDIKTKTGVAPQNLLLDLFVGKS